MFCVREEKLGKMLYDFRNVGKEHFDVRCVSDIFQASGKLCTLFLFSYCITSAKCILALVI
jgi:hypothetical protein